MFLYPRTPPRSRRQEVHASLRIMVSGAESRFTAAVTVVHTHISTNAPTRPSVKIRPTPHAYSPAIDRLSPYRVLLFVPGPPPNPNTATSPSNGGVFKSSSDCISQENNPTWGEVMKAPLPPFLREPCKSCPRMSDGGREHLNTRSCRRGRWHPYHPRATTPRLQVGSSETGIKTEGFVGVARAGRRI